MEQAFLEYLDQLYWEGYGETFREENPKEYKRQLIAFICEHKGTTDRKNSRNTKTKKDGTQHSL